MSSEGDPMALGKAIFDMVKSRIGVLIYSEPIMS